jgi:hypothetical protein
VGIIWLARRARRLEARLDALTRGEDGQSLESVLGGHLEAVDRATRDVATLTTRTAALEADSRLAFQRMGFVRYNPFDDTGGNQSFAFALIDANGDGVILSSLHARGGTRIYAKPVNGGRPDGALSDEEAEALRQAMAGGRPTDRQPA